MASSLLYWLFCIILCSFTKFSVSEVQGENAKPMVTFALNLYRKIARSTDLRKNVLYSPFSAYASMMLLHMGSKGTSRSQIEEAMKWKLLSQASQNAMEKDIVKQFQDALSDQSLSIALKLWQQKYFCTISCDVFIEKIKQLYNIDLGEINFATSPDQSRLKINKWMELETKGNVKKLIPEGHVSSHSRFLLSDALHFNGNWKFKFQKKQTKPVYFYMLGKNGKTNRKKVSSMSVTQTFRFIYAQGRKYGIVEIPFSGNELSMVIIIPNLPSAIRVLEDDLTPSFVTRMLSTLENQSGIKMQLQLPKFKLDVGMDLRKYLEALNISHVFQRDHADLSRIVGYRGLSVSNIYHKASLTVDESTGDASTDAGNDFARYVPKLAINKPFVFFIHHRKTSMILLMGRIMDPTVN